MTNQLWKAMLASPAVLGVAMAGSAIASEAPTVESVEAAAAAEPVQLAQVATVDELSDVFPSDWAYTALQNLVETYGCIEGYPNRTFRGNQALTRYEFAAGLNACLDVLATLITGGGLDQSTLATIQRLQQEFQAELATLRGRVDALEAETAELRAQQFSTTTKLRGQVDANLVVPFGDTGVAPALIDDNTTFTSRARLNFDTSFTGEDRLRVRLQAREGLANAGPLGAAGGLANDGNALNNQTFNLGLDDFYYSFPVGSRLDVIIAANSIVTDDFVTSTIVPFDGPSVADPGGPVLYDVGGFGGGAAAGFSFAITDNFVFDAGYSSGQSTDVNVPGSNNANVGGIFGSAEQSYIAQLSFLSDGVFDGALVYTNGITGGNTEVDTYGGLVSFDFGSFIIAGYYAQHDFTGATAGDTESWQAGIAFPDLFIEGSQLGFYYADLVDATNLANDPYMIEGYYSIPVNEFLTLTPALIYGDLGAGAANEDNFYGALRATFSF
jgi:hypothetical protein